jgi:Uma2 family endonuclease
MVAATSNPYILESEVLESLTDHGFLLFCRDNPTLRYERTSDNKLVVLAPVPTIYGWLNGQLLGELYNWSEANPGGMGFDSSAGFKLADGSIMSPDLSWMPNRKWAAIPPELRNGFAGGCPYFVVELRPPSDRLDYLQSKMHQWIKNGTQLGFLIDPLEKISFVYRANGEVEKFDGFERSLSGEDVLPGFELDLRVLIVKE